VKKLVLVGLLLVSTTSCKKVLKPLRRLDPETKAAQAQALATAPTPVWKEHEVTFAELPKARGSFGIQGTGYNVSFASLPAGTKITLNGQTSIADSGGYAVMKVPLDERIAKLSPKDAFDFRFKLDPQAKIDLEFSPTAKLTLDLPSQSVSYALSELYKKAADTPVALGEDKPVANHSVLLVSSLTPESLGPAKTVAEIDWVALSTKQAPRPGKVCTGYKKIGDKGAKDPSEKAYALQMIDEKVTVYEVKTSKAVDSKDFKAKDQCPSMTFGDKATSYVASDEVKAWLRELRAKVK
jgi:hypothetical protein